jgi:MYXO-CTERM domain-containing protein
MGALLLGLSSYAFAETVNPPDGSDSPDIVIDTGPESDDTGPESDDTGPESDDTVPESDIVIDTWIMAEDAGAPPVDAGKSPADAGAPAGPVADDGGCSVAQQTPPVWLALLALFFLPFVMRRRED